MSAALSAQARGFAPNGVFSGSSGAHFDGLSSHPVQRMSRHGAILPATTYSPSPAQQADFYQTEAGAEEGSVEEGEISILDPRRFTPTLHASLVSEILSLRRELDSKHQFIDHLENNLQVAKTENDSLLVKLSESAKEGRMVKQQLHRLDHDSRRAIEELEKERDQAGRANHDLKSKFESLQMKLRSQEEDSTRTHDFWHEDKESWEGERRALERRIHITESRMKCVLTELATQQALAQANEAAGDGDWDDNGREGGNAAESDTASLRSHGRKGSYPFNRRHIRSMSNNSVYKNLRSSIYGMGGVNGTNAGLSLADELNFDEDDEDYEDFEYDDDDYPEHELRARRALESRQSIRQDDKAKRVLGLTSHNRDNSVQSPEVPDTTVDLEQNQRMQKGINRPVACEYVDTGVQFTPPASPRLSPKPAVVDKGTGPIQIQQDVEANQRRKRVSAGPVAHIFSQLVGVQPKPAPSSTVSVSAQTVTEPLSPPATPATPATPGTPDTPEAPQTQTPTTPVAKAPVEAKPDVSFASTQTDLPSESAPTPIPPKSPKRPIAPPSIEIPSIAIHPPLSAPSSPKQAVLPPHTKNVACQTDRNSSVPTVSVSVQTEEIRVDRRPIKLPAHLQPSSILSRTPSIEPPYKPNNDIPEDRDSRAADSDREQSSVFQPPRIISPPLESPVLPIITEDHYPGNNDNGPLSRDQPDLRRPFRSSSLFAGFDGFESGEEEDADEKKQSDDWDVPPTRSAMPSKGSRSAALFSHPPTPVPEEKAGFDEEREEQKSPVKSDVGPMESHGQSSPRSSLERRSKVGKTFRLANAYKQSNVRRSALIQSGNVAHMRQHSSNTSFGSGGSNGASSGILLPPFPVPTRHSSRQGKHSKSEGSQSPTPRGGGMFPGRRPYPGKQLGPKDSLRKVRSAAVIPRNGRAASRPESPTTPPSLLSPRSGTPQLPPLPKDIITSAQYVYTAPKAPQQPLSSRRTSYTGSTSVASSVNQTSVVDAIAMTMVGEWMWKYVRRGKSFGVPESPQEFGTEGTADMTGNGVRHKRWVWLSPYERTVMWSSKQPTSGSALMGKSGRKRELLLGCTSLCGSRADVLVQFIYSRSWMSRTILLYRRAPALNPSSTGPYSS